MPVTYVPRTFGSTIILTPSSSAGVANPLSVNAYARDGKVNAYGRGDLVIGQGRGSMTYDSTILVESNLVAYYEMNETSGTAATDSSSNAYNGTLHGTVTLNQTKIAAGLGPCMLFDGSTGYITLPTATNTPEPVSFEFWMQAKAISANGFFFNNNPSNGVGIGWDYFSGSKVYVFDAGGGAEPGNLTSDITYYMCLTVDTSHNPNLYAAKVGTDSAPTLLGTFTPGAAPTYSGATYIGVRNDLTQFFKGYISSLAIYSKVLTSAIMNNHYTGGLQNPAPALVNAYGRDGLIIGTGR